MPAGRAVATAATTAADATAATGCAASAGGAGDHASPFRPREAHPGTVLQNLQKQRKRITKQTNTFKAGPAAATTGRSATAATATGRSATAASQRYRCPAVFAGEG